MASIGIKNDWEVIVNENIGMWNVSVWLVNKSYKPSIAHIKGSSIEMTEIKEGEADPEPTLVLNRDIWKALKASMTENHERDKHVVESELSATKYHLEDLRKLVFKA